MNASPVFLLFSFILVVQNSSLGLTSFVPFCVMFLSKLDCCFPKKDSRIIAKFRFLKIALIYLQTMSSDFSVPKNSHSSKSPKSHWPLGMHFAFLEIIESCIGWVTLKKNRRVDFWIEEDR